MKVITTFRHMDPDDQLRSYVEDKVTRLAEKYFHKPQEATIVLETEKFRRMADIIIRADNSVFTGKEEKEDLRSAIDLALDKLEKQGRRHKQKYKKRRGGAEDGASFAVFHGEHEALEEAAAPEVIKVDRFVPKPMTVEDAILLLEDIGDDFVVFRNADSMNICVIFRRPDGNYGLIEPEA